MIEISKKQLDQLEHVKTGGFGSVYKVTDHLAYKIYRHDFYGPDGNVMWNPSLRYPNPRLGLLKKKGKHLKYSDVFLDYIFMNGSFVGVAIPFYQGRYFHRIKEFSFPEKIDASRQMVRNGKELHEHFIYPKDYKLENMILDEEGKVFFFDLDDVCTRVWPIPNAFLDSECRYGLSETIQCLFQDDTYKPYTRAVKEELLRHYESPTYSYSKMLEYIDKKDQKKSFVEIDEESDVSYLKAFLGNYPYSILYRIPKEYPANDDSYYLSIIQKYKEMGVPIFDFIKPYELLEEYSLDFRTEDMVALKGKELVKVKK